MRSLGLPVREIWLIAIVIVALTGGIVAIAVAMPGVGSSRLISTTNTTTDALNGIEAAPTSFSSQP